ncbi:hypothetical protein SAMN05421747_12068 [Parapedobacter composti]|uniref:Uncharacterized protein n=1 Tax=Parapedobacter composti TaxID=623281 RepID=A0A1I1LL24_9SPHI|nr:hypothetical protein SAMN05421747_12068 [Parapedobacter composti]
MMYNELKKDIRRMRRTAARGNSCLSEHVIYWWDSTAHAYHTAPHSRRVVGYGMVNGRYGRLRCR